MLMAFMGMMAQEKVVINMTVPMIPDGTEVTLTNYANYSHLLGIKEQPIAKCIVKDNKAKFEIELSEPRAVQINTSKPTPSNLSLIVSPGDAITVSSNPGAKRLNYADVSGSALNDKFFEIAEKPFHGGTPKGMSQKDYMIQLVKENGNTFFGPLLLYYYSGYGMDYKALYEGFSDEVKNSYHGLALKKLVDMRENERLKREASAFRDSLKEVSRQTPAYDKPENVLDVIVAQYPGNVVFVDFWATWCGPCRRGMQSLKPLEPWMEENGVVRVYLSAPSSDRAKWETMAVGIGGDHYFMNDEEWNAIMKRYGVSGIPYYRIYNKKGKCTFSNIGFPGTDKLKQEFITARQ